MELNLDTLAKIATYIALTIPLIISFFALMNSRYASKLTKEKLRLDLYNKRFDIYLKILDYSLQFRFPITLENNDVNKIYRPDFEISFIKAFRESQFLFKTNSQIYVIIEDIKNECSAIFSHYKYPDLRLNREILLSKQNSIEEKLKMLETALIPYLRFELIYNQKPS